MTVLNLQKNNISDIKKTFTGLKNLQKLDLSFNNIRILNHRVFENVPNLTTLYLSNNTIKELPCKLFNKINILDKLDLSNNEIEEILICAFESLSQLSNLNLHQNNLSHFQIGTFSGLHKLKYLDLSYNKISQLEEAVIHPLDNLEIIDISANKFRNLDPASLLDHLKSLRQIDLSGNTWNCYNLTSARKYLKSRHINYESKILNYEEKNIAGIQCYTNLTNEDLKNDMLSGTSEHNEKMDELLKIIGKYFQQMVNQNQNLTQQIIDELHKLPKAIQETLNTRLPINKANINEMKYEELEEPQHQHPDIQIQNDIVNVLHKIVVILIICICCDVVIYSFKFYKSIKTKSSINNVSSRSDMALLNNTLRSDSLENNV